jgi:hypothetical protein
MHNLTKTLLTSLALTLGACDEPTELGGDFGDEATAFRPTGFNLNTSFIGGQDYGELDLKGLWHKYARVTMVCLSERGVCIYPSKGDALWVEAGEIMAAKNGVKYRGTSFSGSRWYLDLDHDRDGVKDSTIQTLIQKASANKTVQTSVPYWDYTWAYDSKTAAGLVTKYVKQQEAPTPMCEVDVDTGSIASIALENTSIDTTPTTKAIVENIPNSMFVACHSGAAGKAPTWGYVLYKVGHKAYTNVLRVIRADYCNTGMSFTAPGQKVAVTDDIVISDQFDASYTLEGMASMADGWLCLEQPRLVNLAEVTGVCAIPACKDTNFGDPGVDIMTQLP